MYDAVKRSARVTRTPAPLGLKSMMLDSWRWFFEEYLYKQRSQTKPCLVLPEGITSHFASRVGFDHRKVRFDFHIFHSICMPSLTKTWLCPWGSRAMHKRTGFPATA